ncbi:MAG: U32 family peptidase, partial [Clostridiales bacterium]|nr:U32 family peptidase [Clostridiales bacterium]
LLYHMIITSSPWYNLHMTKNISKMELLAPAGSPDSLKVAIASGADAVYLGLEQFNARTSAVNFKKSNLRENIEFCHIHGAKVYLTLNTILYDDEIQTAYETACFAYNNGIDAIIVQDMGLLSVLKKELPLLEIHASTQTSINSKSGVEYMGGMGFSRVILAREMDLSSIKDASSTSTGTEVFVHGARCYSYSGQCLMSSMLGGRSGNRGNCAQPCRLPYLLSNDKGNVLLKGHLLSLKDTLYIGSLKSLRDVGVGAVKIEGRMKTPEYVAAVTSIYRKYLDMTSEYKVTEDDVNDLLKAFNRQGFSKGALSVTPGKKEFSRISPANTGFPVGKVVRSTEKGVFISFNSKIDKSDGLKLNSDGCFAGRDMDMSRHEFLPLTGREGDIVFRTKDISFNKKYELGKVMTASNKIPITAMASILLGKKLFFSATDSSGNFIEAFSDILAEKALSGGTPCERIKDQLLKTGGTPYEITEFKFNCDDGIYIKISTLNDLRRKVLDALTEKRKGMVKKIVPGVIPVATVQYPGTDRLKVSICFYDLPEDIDFSRISADRIYIDYVNYKGNLNKLGNLCRNNGIGFFLLLPYSCSETPDIICDGYLIENHSMIKKLPKSKIVLGSGFNLSNSLAPLTYENIDSFSLSYELTGEKIKNFINSTTVPAEVVVYGKPQVMESPYCPARDICNDDLCIRENLHMKDRKDEEWDVLFDPIKHGVRIFNPHRIMLTESVPFMKEAGIDRFRINILDETAEEVYRIIESVNKGTRPRLNPNYNYTRGHY